MAQVWTTFVDLIPTVGSPVLPIGRASLGPFTRGGPLQQVGESVPSCIGTIRIGFAGEEYPPTRIRADISTPDNGIWLQGIDCPLVIALPLPVNITLRPLTVPLANIRMVVASSEDVDAATDWGPIQSEFLLTGTDYPLMPWCQAVTIHNPDSRGEWFDAAAVSLGEFNGYRPRPRQAVTVRAITEDTLITQHFAS